MIKRIGSEEELEKEAFRMAEGGEEGCRLARDPELLQEILELLKTWIEGQDLGYWRYQRDSPYGYVSYVLSWKQPTTRIGTSYVVPSKGYLLEFSKGYLELRTFSKNRPPGDWIRIAGNRLWRGFRTMPR